MRPLLDWLPWLLLVPSVASAQLPKDWQPWGPDSAQYQIGADTTIAFSGHRSLRLASGPGASADTWVAAIQVVSPAPFRGHRVHLLAAGRTHAAGPASIWLRVEGRLNGAPALLAFDNMAPNRAITGTTEWAAYEVVLDISPDATAIAFGPLLQGTGIFWVDQFALEEVPDSVASTDQLEGPQLSPNPAAAEQDRTTRPVVLRPSNLDFEQ